MLIELLVTIAIIAVLAAILLPALSHAKASGLTEQCTNNKRQITTAWLTYAHDFNDAMTLNPYDWLETMPWTSDGQSWENHPQTTNIMYMMNPAYATLATYAVNKDIYLCPADRYVSPAQKAAGMKQRFRSITMNYTMGAPPVKPMTWRIYAKMLDIPRPAERFVFMDTHPDWLRGASFLVNPNLVGSVITWFEVPSSLHNRGATLSFADGHTERKKWVVPETMQPVRYQVRPTVARSRPDDLRWVWLRTGEVKTSQFAATTQRDDLAVSGATE